MPELTNKRHEIFVRQYVLNWDKASSYAVAYPKANKHTCAVNPQWLLEKEEVKARIAELTEDDERFLGISKRLIAQYHVDIIKSSISKFNNSWVTRKEFNEIPERDLACIREVEFEKRPVYDGNGGVEYVEMVRIRLYDRQKSLDSISKMFGYEAPKVKITSKQVFKKIIIQPASERRTSAAADSQ